MRAELQGGGGRGGGGGGGEQSCAAATAACWQGKPSQGTAGEPQPPRRVQHPQRATSPPVQHPQRATSPLGGVPAPSRGHPLRQAQHKVRALFRPRFFSSRHTGLAAAGGFVWLFLLFSFMAGSLLCISNSNRVTQVIIQLPLGLAPAQLGHVSDTWHHARREGDKGIDTLCPKGKQMASINSSGRGDLRELAGIQQVSRRQTPPRVSVRREAVPSPVPPPPSSALG